MPRLSRVVNLLPRVSVAALLIGAGCGGSPVVHSDGGAPDISGDRGDVGSAAPGLRLNEIASNDDGTAIDEAGEIEDWIELVNTAGEPIDLAGFTLTDGNHRPQRLPAQLLAAGETVVFWADEQPEQGSHHLGFKISAAGERIVLGAFGGGPVDAAVVPALELNHAYARFPNGSGAFASCNYATPSRVNGAQCGPPPAPALPREIEFAPYAFPDTEPTAPAPLAITQLALFPARFIEVENTSTVPLDLSQYVVRLQPLSPGGPLPGAESGTALRWPASDMPAIALAPGARLTVPVDPAAEASLGVAHPEREGSVSIFRAGDGTRIDRVDFMHWPDDAILVRERAGTDGGPGATFKFCAPSAATLPQPAPASCAGLAARDVGDRLHALRTSSDFGALAAGNTEIASQSVKFVVDTERGDTLHFLGARRWDLHYRFVREKIYGQAPLDRCDPVQAAAFHEGWVEFSRREYSNVARRFLLGTLVRWPGSGQATVEFAVGDVITGEQMRRAFFAVTAGLPAAERRTWAVRPQAADQVHRLRSVEGTLPIVDPNAPFRGQTFQPLVAATGYGVLRFVAGGTLATAALGADVILITDEVPNDIPLVGGLITEAFQTPLSHVAVLSKNRGTPNMALTAARTDVRVGPFIGKLVRLDVSGAGFKIAEATAEEAAAFWDKLRPKGPRLAPRLDATVRDFVDLTADGSLDDLPVVGAKAAQIGELFRLATSGVACPFGLPLPRDAFALPVAHYLDHFQASGAAAIFAARSASPAFAADPRVRAQGLAEVRAAITGTAVDPALLQRLRAGIDSRFGGARVRLRSSSNTEDLPGFTGAGLYASVSVSTALPADPQLDVADGLRTVWASLWQPRAYDERELGLIDHTRAAMGVLVEGAFTNERANGVAISRNILDPVRGDAYYFNAQAGEASVTNPAPGVVSEQGTFQLGWAGRVDYITRSSLIPGPVITGDELSTLMCALGAIHSHFRARLDPIHLDRWFAIDIEWKLLGPERQLLVKQARPYSFGSRVDVPTDCREF